VSPAGIAVRRVGHVLLGTLAVAAVGFGLRGATASPAPTDSESSLAARAFAVARAGLDLLPPSWHPDTVSAVQIATYSLWRRIAAGPSSALVEAREAMLVAAVITAALLWVLARRLELSPIGSAVAVLAWGLTPFAVGLHRTVDAVNLALPWLLAACVLTAATASKRLATAAAMGCALLAVATAPIVLVPMLAGLAAVLATGGALTRAPAAVRLGFAAGLGAGALVAHLVVTRDSVAPDGAAIVDALRPADLVIGALVLVAAAAAVAIAWLRPLAIVLTVLVAAALALGPLDLRELTLAVPLAALLLGGVVDAAGHRLLRRRPGLLTLAAAAAGLVLVLVGAAGAASAPALQATGTDTARAQARAWVVDELEPSAVLVADDALWAELIRSGWPEDRIISYTGFATQDRAAGDRVEQLLDGTAAGRPVYLVGHPVDEDASRLARRVAASSVPVAMFGRGDERTEVRQVVADVAAARRTASAERAARAEAGTELAANPGLVLGAEARSALRSGSVDPRVLAVLATVSAQRLLTVPAIENAHGETDATAPRRTLVITEVERTPVADAPETVALLRRWFVGQLPPYRPASVVLDRDRPTPALLVHYRAPTPTGLFTP